MSPAVMSGFELVYILTLWEPGQPVYHRHEGLRHTERGDTLDVTGCGRTITSWHPQWGYRRHDISHLRREHADAFARPCKVCFRAGDQ